MTTRLQTTAASCRNQAISSVTKLKYCCDSGAMPQVYCGCNSMQLQKLLALCLLMTALLAAQKPQALPGGYALPNGWRLTPIGKNLETNDMVLNATAAPDGLAVIAMHAGYNPHGLVVVDTRTEQIIQRIPLKS